MEPDYAGSQLGGNAAREVKPLESINTAAQRVNTAAVRISNFIDRFHGDSPKEPQSNAIEASPPAYPYSLSLDRLMGALDRLETRVEGLDRIG